MAGVQTLPAIPFVLVLCYNKRHLVIKLSLWGYGFMESGMTVHSQAKTHRIAIIVFIIVLGVTLLAVSSIQSVEGYLDPGNRTASSHDVHFTRLSTGGGVDLYEAPNGAVQYESHPVSAQRLFRCSAYGVLLAWLLAVLRRKRLELFFLNCFSLYKQDVVSSIALSIGGHAPPVYSRKSCMQNQACMA